MSGSAATRRLRARRCWSPPAAAGAVSLLVLVLLAPAAAGAAAVVQMAQPTLVLPPPINSSSSSESSSNSGGSSTVRIGVKLTGPAAQRVSVALNVLLPGGGAWAAADPSSLWLEPASLTWAAWEKPGTKFVTLQSAAELPLALVLPTSGADGKSWPLLRVALAAAHGAAIAAAQNATTVTLEEGNSAAASSSPPLFGFVANQAVYPPSDGAASAARIPVRLLAGQLRETATLRFSVRQLHPPAAAGHALQFLPTRATHGFVSFKPAPVGAQQQQTMKQWIELPLAWDRIPPEAEIRLGLELEGVYNARVVSQPAAVALHVFGTPLGTCPPGSSLSELGRNSSGGSGGSSNSSGLPPAGGEGDPFVLSFNGSVIDLSSSFQPDVFRYGAEVEPDVQNVTLCLRKGRQSSGAVILLPAAGRPNATDPPVRLEEEDTALACGCEPPEEGGQGEEESEGGDAGEGGACPYEAWLLPLHAGQNRFNITLTSEQEAADANSSSSSNPEGSKPYGLTVVRLADPVNAELESITVKSSSGESIVLCGPPSTERLSAGRAALDCEAAVQLPHCVQPCVPGALLSLNVSDAGQVVSVTPTLKRPYVDGIRVEVNGQVLSRGGDVAADRLEDTTAEQQQRTNASFLPSAFIMGLQPGSTLDAEVVVVAEDGVTTCRYPLQFLRVEGELTLSVASAPGAAAGMGVFAGANASAAGAWRSPGWPLPPAEQAICSVCPRGWAAGEANSTACHMCPPGTHAPGERSPACLPCAPGSFAYSWGSAYCKNCIEGTYAPIANSSLCVTCPANTTTARDGEAACTVPQRAGGYSAPRYAVVVDFYVVLTGLDLDDVVVRAGVADVPPTDIITNLLRSDTAFRFNISQEDVMVSVHHVARRTLTANVTATLGVDVPDGATDEDISAALEVQRLSADDPIDMLSSDPDRFFGRTTKTLDVQVASTLQATTERWGDGTNACLLWGMLAPGILAIVAGTGLVFVGCRRSKGCARWRGAAARRLSTSRLAPRAQQYSRWGGGAEAAHPA